MDMTGEYRIPAPQATVWEGLNDPETLRACIPGCQALEKVSDDTMTATVLSKVGPVKATFTGEVKLTNIDPPNGYRISGEGKGGAAGFARGHADVTLVPDGEETVLRYTAKAQVGGKLAQLGARLIDSTAKKMADDFFGNFAVRLGASEGPIEPTIGVDEYVNAPANVPVQHQRPGEPVVEDKAEEAADFAEEVEEKIEEAAGRGFLGGPMVWGLLVLLVIIAAILIFRPA